MTLIILNISLILNKIKIISKNFSNIIDYLIYSIYLPQNMYFQIGFGILIDQIRSFNLWGDLLMSEIWRIHNYKLSSLIYFYRLNLILNFWTNFLHPCHEIAMSYLIGILKKKKKVKNKKRQKVGLGWWSFGERYF